VAQLAVLGSGGVGGFLAAALDRAGEPVLVVGRERSAAAIAAGGIEVRSVVLGEFLARPRAAPVLAEPVETLFVATKFTGLERALERIESEPELVVPLLNGLEHMAVLRARFGAERVAAGAIRVESDRPRTGEIVQSSRFLRIDLAADEPNARARLPALAAILGRAGVPVAIERSEVQVLWSKLVRLSALALTTSASGRPLGLIRTDPVWGSRLRACVREAVAVGLAEGAELSVSSTLGELGDAHASLGSSMQRDLAAGREPELDAIAGALMRAGARHGLRCPTIALLAGEVAARAGLPKRAYSGGRSGSG
jgi:2-dehydropantoate 2-reductase